MTVKYGAESSGSTVMLYGANFPPVVAYAAPMPSLEEPWQSWIGSTVNIPPLCPEDDKPELDKTGLDELIDAVLALKAQSVEIYQLKALACTIRDRNIIIDSGTLLKARQQNREAFFDYDPDLHMGGKVEETRGKTWLESQTKKDK